MNQQTTNRDTGRHECAGEFRDIHIDSGQPADPA